MTLDRAVVAAIRKALDDAQGVSAAEALPLLREAADKLTELIDDSMAEAVLTDGASLRAAGAGVGLSENAVGPRLARTAALSAYANDSGRITAAAVERARYDRELGTPRTAAQPPPKPMRFSPRRRTS
jgi:hypothetical protein